MFWPMRLGFVLLWRFRLVVTSVLAGMGLAYGIQLRQQQRTWGVVPADAARPLPGDELVEPATIVDTRSLDIDAPPAAVWPWLVQMGWGRGGWYSYDRLDMDTRSADTILAEHQDLAEGDLVPTHPGGGFVARVVQPNGALVLYLDSALVTQQAGEEADEDVDEDTGGRPTAEGLPGGLQVAGFMGEMTMPEFRASWAFVLEDAPGGRCHLVERFRVWAPEAGMGQRLGMPLMGAGVFAMTRKHMLGVKERAERHATH